LSIVFDLIRIKTVITEHEPIKKSISKFQRLELFRSLTSGKSSNDSTCSRFRATSLKHCLILGRSSYMFDFFDSTQESNRFED
jgi:hypothetical protein